jgi:hypothetical protein
MNTTDPRDAEIAALVAENEALHEKLSRKDEVCNDTINAALTTPDPAREPAANAGDQAAAIVDHVYEHVGFKSRDRLIADVQAMLPRPTAVGAGDLVKAYQCPAGCGCMWRDNRDGTMSLFDGEQKSCAVCEPMPLAKLAPMVIADNLFIEARDDGYWHVCVEKVYATEDEARASCRRWKKTYSTVRTTANGAAGVTP